MEEQQELTVMFYFASDNPLAPLIISEIKAIKDAGFQEHTNVLVYFDPMEKGARTRKRGGATVPRMGVDPSGTE